MAATLGGLEVLHLILLAGGTVSAAGHRANAVSASRRVKARSNHHGEHKFIPAIAVIECVEILDVDIDVFARLNIRDFLREDIGPFLGQERGGVALPLGSNIDFLSLLAFTDDAPDASLANHHDKFIHSGILRQWEHVNRLNLGVIGIIEFLDNLNTGNIAINSSLNGRVLEGQGDLLPGIGQPGHERATTRVILWRLGIFIIRLGDDPQFLFQGGH